MTKRPALTGVWQERLPVGGPHHGVAMPNEEESERVRSYLEDRPARDEPRGPVNDSDENLARWRELYPFISIGAAKALRRVEMQFGHLGALEKTREREAAQERAHQLRERLFGGSRLPSADGGVDATNSFADQEN
jgi:hypothetical protein